MPRSELKKQFIDQPLHVVVCAASVLGASLLVYIAGVYTFWGFTPGGSLGRFAGLAGILITVGWNAAREMVQWPPRQSAKWDPYVDWAFEGLGTAGGGVLWFLVMVPVLR
jgi:hypothetical protein